MKTPPTENVPVFSAADIARCPVPIQTIAKELELEGYLSIIRAEPGETS